MTDPDTHVTLTQLDAQGRPLQQLAGDGGLTQWQRDGNGRVTVQTDPLGRTATYSEIAKALGQPKAVRAVAQACAANNLALLVPCHRVIREDGDLAGYRWGLERKRALLERERQAAAADAAA